MGLREIFVIFSFQLLFMLTTHWLTLSDLVSLLLVLCQCVGLHWGMAIKCFVILKCIINNNLPLQPSYQQANSTPAVPYCLLSNLLFYLNHSHYASLHQYTLTSGDNAYNQLSLQRAFAVAETLWFSILLWKQKASHRDCSHLIIEMLRISDPIIKIMLSDWNSMCPPCLTSTSYHEETEAIKVVGLGYLLPRSEAFFLRVAKSKQAAWVQLTSIQQTREGNFTFGLLSTFLSGTQLCLKMSSTT